MKELKKPFFIAILYLIIFIMSLVLNDYLLLPAYIKHATEGPNYNLDMARIYDNYRGINFLIMHVSIFIGSFHTFLELPIPRKNKKYTVYASLILAFVVVPIVFVYASKVSYDGSMIFLALPSTSVLVASIFIVISGLVLLIIKFTKAKFKQKD